MSIIYSDNCNCVKSMRRYEGNLKSWMINMHQEQWYLTALWFSHPLIMALTVTIIWSMVSSSTFETILIFLSLFITVLCVKGKLGAPDLSSAQRSEMRVEIVELQSTQKSSNLLLRHVLTPIWQVAAAVLGQFYGQKVGIFLWEKKYSFPKSFLFTCLFSLYSSYP